MFTNNNYQTIVKEMIDLVSNSPNKQPVYYAPVYSSNCRWDVYVNDVLLYHFPAKKGETPLFAINKNNIYSYLIYLHRLYPNAPLKE